MQTEILLIGIALLLLGGFAVHTHAQNQKKTPEESSGSHGDAALRAAVEQARADVDRVGWHLVAVPGAEGARGYVYTLGLWESYQHPEVLLFSPSEDPMGIARSLQALVERIAKGEKFAADDTLPGVFGKHAGALREVNSQWHGQYLGVSEAFYGDTEVPFIQLFWPDREGLFPWQSDFARGLFTQPLLFQSNLLLANVGHSGIQYFVAQGGAEALESSLAELFQPPPATDQDLLATWRWRVGDEAEVLRVTPFGSLFLKTPDGTIHWLDTGADIFDPIAKDEASWLQVVSDRLIAFVPVGTLLEVQALGLHPKEGYVYDWIQAPIFGGEFSADNVQTVPLTAQLEFMGRAIEKALAGASAQGEEREDDGTIYNVVRNAEGQYSIWPVDREIPEGWEGVGKTGTKAECTEYIAEAMEG